MKIILKPAGMAILAVILVTLIIIIVAPQGIGGGAKATPATTPKAMMPSPQTKPATGETKFPYTLETPGETLRNPGFEADYAPIRPYDKTATLHGKTAAHWYDDSSWAKIAINYARDDTAPHSGAFCQKITVQQVTFGSCQFVQPLRLTPGRTYTGGLWLRAPRPTVVHVMLRKAMQPGVTYSVTDATVGPKWQQVSTTGTIGTDGVAYLMLRLDTAGSVWVDDATLTARS